ncbi:MAG: ATP-binding protein [Bacteroidales bacterium]|nr:ATP-binding protein [Bacteroidales bacterium]
MYQDNPFVIEGYVGPEYFCDRVEETALLKEHITNGRNVALIAKRRLGKSGLIHNLFSQDEIRERYNTFYVDIYETKNMNEFVFELGKNIFSKLKTEGRKAWEGFISALASLQHTFTFSSNGLPQWSVKLGDITHPDVTLDEIFTYLNNSERRNIVAIDEFQIIADYPEKTVEAALRTRIQNCHNTRFIYSGSHLHMMSLIFSSPSRPFYNSCSLMGLGAIDRKKYLEFANGHLNSNVQSISEEAFYYLYDRFDGYTWYIQYVLNILYSTTTTDITFGKEHVDKAIDDIVSRNSFSYSTLMSFLSAKQKQLLYAIAAEKEVESLMSREFLAKYSMSASTVQTSLKALQDHDFVTRKDDASNAYMVYDRFLDIWLRR